MHLDIKMMKKIAIIACLLVSSIYMWAEYTIIPLLPDSGVVLPQDTIQELIPEPIVRPNLLDSMHGVEVVQDTAMAIVLESVMFGKRELVEIDGFRVQVYSSNQQQKAKTEALNLESSLKNKVNQTIYVVYLPPFWKVRVGDFRTYEEAREYKKQFVQLFPNLLGDTYIVRDKVKVMQ